MVNVGHLRKHAQVLRSICVVAMAHARLSSPRWTLRGILQGAVKHTSCGMPRFAFPHLACPPGFNFCRGVLQEAVKHTEYHWLRDGSGRAPGLIGWFPDMSVTFVDNHDTGSTQQVRLDARAAACWGVSSILDC